MSDESKPEVTDEAPVIETKPEPSAPALDPIEEKYGISERHFKEMRAMFVCAEIASGRYSSAERGELLKAADAALHAALTEPFTAK